MSDLRPCGQSPGETAVCNLGPPLALSRRKCWRRKTAGELCHIRLCIDPNIIAHRSGSSRTQGGSRSALLLASLASSGDMFTWNGIWPHRRPPTGFGIAQLLRFFVDRAPLAISHPMFCAEGQQSSLWADQSETQQLTVLPFFDGLMSFLLNYVSYVSISSNEQCVDRNLLGLDRTTLFNFLPSRLD